MSFAWRCLLLAVVVLIVVVIHLVVLLIPRKTIYFAINILGHCLLALRAIKRTAWLVEQTV